MKRLLMLPVAAFLIGCGGGSSSDIDNFNLSKAIEGKTFYEASACKEPNYYSYKIDKSALIQKAYSDSNFSQVEYSKNYSVKTFNSDDISLVKNGIEYFCEVDYDVDNNKVTQLGLNCSSENENSEDLFFLAAYPTKELALKNKETKCN